MAVIVNDIDELPIKILQLDLKRLTLLDSQFLDDMHNNFRNMKIVKRNNYWLIPTEVGMNTLKIEKRMMFITRFLRMCRQLKSYTHLMIVTNEK